MSRHIEDVCTLDLAGWPSGFSNQQSGMLLFLPLRTQTIGSKMTVTECDKVRDSDQQ